MIRPALALYLFSGIILISIVLTVWVGDNKNSRVHTFVNILIGLGIFATFFFYYTGLVSQNQREKLDIIQEAHHISNSIRENITREIRESINIIPNFIFSIHPLLKEPFTEDPVNKDTIIRKNILSYYIFLLWDDLITSKDFINIELAYITNFLQRANSKQLYSQWIISKINFRQDTQIFGDLLFEYALPITNQTPEEYINTAKKLIMDQRYKNILKK